MSILLKNGRVINPATNMDKKADVLIANGIVKQIKQSLNEKAAKMIDAKDLIVCPGLIDSHVHLREPGFEEKETIETGSRAAIAGGVTSLLSMPNTNPVADEPSVIDFIKEKQSRAGLASVYPVAALTKKSQGKELSEMYHLSEAGAVAFSDDGKNIDDPLLMRRAMEYSLLVNKPIMVHAEDNSLAGGGQINEGLMSTKLGLKGIPALAEELVIFRDIELVRLTGARVHFMHLSSAGSVALIRAAKNNKLPITCEVTPHHMFLDETMLENYDTNLKVKPPLRTKDDRKALLEGLSDGTIDCIATDHAPHAKHQKELEFDYAHFGMVGLETILSLVLTYLENKLGLVKLLQKMTSNPAKIFGLEAGSLNEGDTADVILINPKAQVKVDIDNFFSKSSNSPFNGWDVKGKIETVIKSGKIVYNKGQFTTVTGASVK